MSWEWIGDKNYISDLGKARGHKFWPGDVVVDQECLLWEISEVYAQPNSNWRAKSRHGDAEFFAYEVVPYQRSECDLTESEFFEEGELEIFSDKTFMDPEINLDLPVRVPVGERSCWRWRGAEFATREEMLLGKALLDQGAMVASNSHLLLRQSEKLHRKPDLMVFLPYEDRLIAGLAEVDGSAHDGRWVEDQTRSHELQRNGFMAVRHYTAEQVFQDPTKAATDFIEFLKQFHPFGQRSGLLRF